MECKYSFHLRISENDSAHEETNGGYEVVFWFIASICILEYVEATRDYDGENVLTIF